MGDLLVAAVAAQARSPNATVLTARPAAPVRTVERFDLPVDTADSHPRRLHEDWPEPYDDLADDEG
jgi:hypothetical protein